MTKSEGLSITFVHTPNNIWLDEEGKYIRTTPMEALLGASALIRRGHLCNIVDLQNIPSDESFTRIAERIAGMGPDIVLFTGMVTLSPRIFFLAEAIKRLTSAPLGLSGYAVESIGDMILRRMKCIDFILHHNNFLALGLLRPDKRHLWDSSPSLTYRVDGCVKTSISPAQETPLDTVQDFSLVPLENYHVIATFASHGCPNRCSFCKRTKLYGTVLRTRPPAVLREELKLLLDDRRLNEKAWLYFADDVFAGSPEHGIDVCQVLRETDTLPWSGFYRVDRLTEELLSEMHLSKCRSICLGIESGSDRMLGHMRKGFTVEQAKHGILLAAKRLERVEVAFVWGFPHETREDFIKTVELARWATDAGAYLRSFCPLMLFPGTEDYRRYLETTIRYGLVSVGEYEEEDDVMAELELKMVKENPELFSHYFFVPTEELVYKASIAYHLCFGRTGAGQDHVSFRFGAFP